MHIPTADYPIKKGDLFIQLPAKQYYIESIDNLKYIYISYGGNRSHELLDRIRFSEKNPVYPGFDELIPFWERSVESVSKDNIDLMTEGVLLYTLSCICSTFFSDKTEAEAQNWILYIKQYVDEHYNDCNLNMKKISEMYSYNYKYISKMFIRTVGIGFGEYLTKLRLENAAKMMDNGFISVKEIANLSGFNDALYFSKLFKKSYGLSPREYIKRVKAGEVKKPKTHE